MSRLRSAWLGDHEAGGGIYEDVACGAVDTLRSPYKVYIEEFRHVVLSGTTGIAEMGWTIDDLNSATIPSSSVRPEFQALVLAPGTKADSGTQYQKILVPNQTTYLTPAHEVLGPIISSNDRMDNREIFFQTRVGFASSSAVWTGKALIGWYTTDSSLIATAGGLPTVAAGGGFGFHIGEDGVISFHCSPDAITTAGTATIYDITTLTGASLYTYFVLGARMRVVDASASTGECTFYINGNDIGTIANTTCMDSTETFSYSMAVLNGGEAANHAIRIDYIVTGITREGLTYPYDSASDIASF